MTVLGLLGTTQLVLLVLALLTAVRVGDGEGRSLVAAAHRTTSATGPAS